MKRSKINKVCVSAFVLQVFAKTLHKKRKFSTKDFFRKYEKFAIFNGFFTFTKENRNRKPRFLCS